MASVNPEAEGPRRGLDRPTIKDGYQRLGAQCIWVFNRDGANGVGKLLDFVVQST